MQVPLQIEFSQDGYSLQHRQGNKTGSSTQGEGSSAPSASSRTDPSTLTKSRYLTGLDNPREMWFETHGSSKPDLGEQWRLRQGQLVGKLARRQFPEGSFVGGLLR